MEEKRTFRNCIAGDRLFISVDGKVVKKKIKSVKSLPIGVEFHLEDKRIISFIGWELDMDARLTEIDGVMSYIATTVDGLHDYLLSTRSVIDEEISAVNRYKIKQQNNFNTED